MYNRYEHSFTVRCPVDGSEIAYRLKILHARMLRVETIVSMCTITEPSFHEHIADALAVLGGRQWLRAVHGEVLVMTYRHVKTGVYRRDCALPL
jgi:hypothetical protein